MSSPWVQGGSFLVEGKRGQVLGMDYAGGRHTGWSLQFTGGAAEVSQRTASPLNTSKFLASLDQVLSSFPLC